MKSSDHGLEDNQDELTIEDTAKEGSETDAELDCTSDEAADCDEDVDLDKPEESEWNDIEVGYTVRTGLPKVPVFFAIAGLMALLMVGASHFMFSSPDPTLKALSALKNQDKAFFTELAAQNLAVQQQVDDVLTAIFSDSDATLTKAKTSKLKDYETGYVLTATVPHLRLERDLKFELQLIEDDGAWSITRIVNLSQLQEDLAAAAKQKLEDYNHPIEERMELAVTVLEPKLLKQENGRVTFSAQVKSAEGIQAFSAVVNFFTDEYLLGVMTITGENLTSTSKEMVWEETVTLFGENDGTLPEGVQYQVQLESATFGDGSILKRAKTFADIQH